MGHVLLLLAALAASPASAGWLDQLREMVDDGASASGGEADNLSRQELVAGVLEALSQGVQRAVTQLGETGGYLEDPQVHIPLPAQLAPVQSLLDRVGQGEQADRFVVAMNRAAEQAVPAAKAVFLDAVRAMRVDDARAIVTGPANAATEYFRTHTRGELQAQFLPIVRRATDEAQVTAYYKQLVERAQSWSGGLLAPQRLDLDGYVTDKALDGLFLKLEEEERRIRADPVARTSDVLKKVFGARR